MLETFWCYLRLFIESSRFICSCNANRVDQVMKTKSQAGTDELYLNRRSGRYDYILDIIEALA